MLYAYLERRSGQSNVGQRGQPAWLRNPKALWQSPKMEIVGVSLRRGNACRSVPAVLSASEQVRQALGVLVGRCGTLRMEQKSNGKRDQGRKDLPAAAGQPMDTV